MECDVTQPRPEIAQHMEQALACHKAGRLPEASAHYERVLAADPRHADAHNLLGSLKAQTGQPAEGLKLIAAAIEIRPDSPVFWCNHGNVLTALGRPDDAIGSYERAIGLAPEMIEPHYNRTKLLIGRGSPGEALAALDRVLKTSPGHHVLMTARGSALLALKQPGDALTAFEAAIAVAARNVDAISGRGLALLDLERPAEALSAFDHALRLVPGDLTSVYGRAQAQIALSQAPVALATMDKVLAVLPKDPMAHLTKGLALLALVRAADAVQSFAEAVRLDPQSQGAAYHYAQALRQCGRNVEAAQAFQRVLEIDPDHTHAMTALAESAMQCADWSTRDRLAPLIEAKVRAGSRGLLPFSFLSLCDSPELQTACCKAFARATCPSPVAPLPPKKRRSTDRIRLGYLSSDFRRHAMAYQMVELFELHDRERFEVVGFSCIRDDGSPVRRRIFQAFDEVHEVETLGNEAIARLINERSIDVLVDLNGHTAHGRVAALAWRPAPVQATYLGFPGTTGTPFIDYVIADDIVAPHGDEHLFSEQIVRLPGCYQVSDSKRQPSPIVPSRASQGLPEQGFVFVCFNSIYKVSSAIFDVWMRILHAVPGSVLWLVRSNDAMVQNLRREARARGIDPIRLVFCSVVEPDIHLARHALADLYLDTLPYNSHGTGSFALWGGLPMLACYGPTFAGRVAASLLRAVGLPELVAGSLDEYEARAVELARDPAQLSGLRRRLEANRRTAPLFDTDLFRRHIEAGYRGMHETACRGEPPRAFDVPFLG